MTEAERTVVPRFAPKARSASRVSLADIGPPDSASISSNNTTNDSFFLFMAVVRDAQSDQRYFKPHVSHAIAGNFPRSHRLRSTFQTARQRGQRKGRAVLAQMMTSVTTAKNTTGAVLARRSSPELA